MTTQVLSKQQLEQYHRDGFVAVPDVLSAAEVDELRGACARLIDQFDPSKHPATTFSTDDNKQDRGDYFLNSGDDIRFFFEEDAIDKEGKLKVTKELSLNKIGHALHWQVPEFRRASFSDRVKCVARQLGFVRPALVQSMYIFKQPGYGGEVCPHKDCTFLSTEPQSCVGLWFALQDATLDNGCMHFSPGSQHTPTTRRFVRVVGDDGSISTTFTAPSDPDQPDKYIAVPVNKGSLVLINGSVDHKSARNLSENSRHIYTFHMIEQHETRWDPLNWLQPTTAMPFTALYDN